MCLDTGFWDHVVLKLGGLSLRSGVICAVTIGSLISSQFFSLFVLVRE